MDFNKWLYSQLLFKDIVVLHKHTQWKLVSCLIIAATIVSFVYSFYFQFFVHFWNLHILIRYGEKGLSPLASVFITFSDLNKNNSFITWEPEAKLMPFKKKLEETLIHRMFIFTIIKVQRPSFQNITRVMTPYQ